MNDYRLDEIKQWVIEDPFTGGCQTWINPKTGKIEYAGDENLAQYSARNGKKFRIVDNDELNRLHAEFWSQPFTAITEEQWEESLECLPPLKWHNLNKQWNVFFCSEAMSGQFHGCYLLDRVNNKHYSGMKSIFSSDANLLADIEKEIMPFLFVACHVACYSYCDTTVEKHGDYLEIGRIHYSPLRVEIFQQDSKYAAVHKLMQAEYEKLSKQDSVQISATGQTAKITLK